MIFKIYHSLVFLYLFFVFFQVNAQTTDFEAVYSIFETKCTLGCHSGPSPSANLDLGADLETVYSNLINIEPTNPAAINAGYKLVKQGFPDESFLFRKCNSNQYHTSVLELAEGGNMPPYGAPSLTPKEIDLVRQWILFGADFDTEELNQSILETFHAEGGFPSLEPLDAPPAGEGIQFYFGKLYLEPGGEMEFHKKVFFDIPDSLEVYRIEMRMSEFSHHCVVNKFHPESHEAFDDGIIMVNGLIDAYAYFLESDFIVNSQYAEFDLELPEGTAFVWEENPVIDLNYHIKNYSSTGIIPVEFYVNLYTQPIGTANFQMFSETINYGGTNPFSLLIPNNGEEKTFSMEHFMEASPEIRNYWTLIGHTHGLGLDYDMFYRNPDGSKGAQIYEGFYNADYSFDQGYFDFAHPPLLQADPLIEVDMSNGLIMEATYKNEGPAPVSFGLTTEDEMFAGYLLYTVSGLSSGLNDNSLIAKKDVIKVSPNPIQDQALIQYSIDRPGQIWMKLHLANGKMIKQLIAEQWKPAGKHEFTINTSDLNLSPGFYLIELMHNETLYTQRLILTD